MKEFVEKLIERLEEKSFIMQCADNKFHNFINVDKIKNTINQLSEEFATDINVGSKDEKAEQIADDLSKVLKEAKSMGCKEVKYFHHIPLENVEIVINALRAYNQDSTKKNQGWISVKERLPEENERVLCVTKKGRMETAIYRYGGFWACGSTWLKQTIAWMPLPTYKSEEKNEEPKTRIEHLRSMTAEELADVILKRSEISTAIDFCQNFEQCYESISESECRKCLIKYLNSPVEQKKTIPTEYFKERFNRVI